MRDKKSLFALALDEYVITRQISTGNGGFYLSMYGLRGEPIPGWFIRDDLGYDGIGFFRLREMIPQAELDSRHQDAMNESPVPAPNVVLDGEGEKKRRRETKASRLAKLQQLETRALMLRAA